MKAFVYTHPKIEKYNLPKKRKTMTLQQMQQIITIADSKSMNEAAKKLYVSQPNLSAVVKRFRTGKK